MTTDVDTYKGESPGKKVARAVYWRMVRQHLGQRFFFSRHLFLCSREGGDIAVLSAHGAARMGIAVDRSEEACSLARQRHPTADIRHADVVSVARSEGAGLCHAFLDFCGPLGAETIRSAVGVASMLSHGDLLGVAVLRGRERATGSRLSLNMATRRQRRTLVAMARSSDAGRRQRGLVARLCTEETGFDASALAREMRDAAHTDASVGRAAALWTAVNGAADFRKRQLWGIGIVSYQSRTQDSCGVPMTIVLSRVVDLRLVKPGHSRLRAHSFSHLSLAADESEVRRMALAEDFSAAELNIAPATLAAWKAHATRGTYDKTTAAAE